MLKSRPLYIITLMLAMSWLVATALVDFAVVPSLFRHLKDFFEAGNLGTVLFSKFNIVELILGTSIAILLLVVTKKNPTLRILFFLSSILLLIALTYFFYLTPKLISLTDLWQKAEASGAIGAGDIPDIQQHHQLFHKIYVTLDSVKMLLLLTLVILGLKNESKVTHD